MNLRIKGINWGLTFAILTLLLTTLGCSSGGGSDSATLTGVFLDSPVSGLGYETDTFQGVTGSGGAFSYNRGETVRFFVGDTTLCETPAASTVTPIDCVEGAIDETHPMVTNMLVFLQSIDFDNDPENGIDITELMQQEARGMQLDFDCDPAAFMEDYDFRNYLEMLNSQEMSPNFEDRIPPSIEQARQHMRETMIEYGLYGYGPGMQNDSSTALTGVFLDSPVSGLEYETDTFQGVTGSGGAFSYNRGETIRFFVGDTTLCETPAASIVTPIDCVEGATDETHPMVTNMLVFLQSIDFDNDPENGIDITELMQQEARGMRLDFDCDPAAFMEDYDFRNYLEMLNSQEMSPNFEDRIPPSIEQARQHMQETMIEHGLYGYGPGRQNMSNNLP